MAEGYKTVTPIIISNVIGALSCGVIKLQAVQVFFGCLELLAIREAAKRTTGRSRG